MSSRIPKRRRSGRVTQFDAPLGRTVKLATGASLLILVTVIVVPQLALSGKPAPIWVRWIVPSLVLTVFGVVALFSVRGYAVTGRELWIQRACWQTRYSLDQLQSAHADPGAMQGSLRMAGNGGLFAFTGWFRNKKLGTYRAFVTDQTRCVVMEFKDRKIVVSPGDPAGFLRALGFEPCSNSNQR